MSFIYRNSRDENDLLINLIEPWTQKKTTTAKAELLRSKGKNGLFNTMENGEVIFFSSIKNDLKI